MSKSEDIYKATEYEVARIKRVEILKTAEKIISKDRQNSYGNPEDNFKTIARYWNIYLSSINNNYVACIGPDNVAMMMVLLKIARTATSPKYEDNYIDICGYAANAAEVAERVCCKNDK